MDISVVLCTYNRCESLAEALSSVAASILPETVTWEILVVDNNSKDRTRQAVEEFSSRVCGRVRYVFEARQGLSNARNAGIAEAQGEVLAFMDDDVTVQPSWLWNLARPLARGEWAGAGGRTLPSQPFSPPAWLSGDESSYWGGILGGLFDLGTEPCELSQAPYGTNMAFRKEMFQRHGLFRPDLGRSGRNLMSNEDTEFGKRLLAAGERLRYEPTAIVYHPILQDRVRKPYFLKWWFAYGRSVAREDRMKLRAQGRFRAWLRVPRLGVHFLGEAVRWVRSGNAPQRFQRRCRMWMTVGRMLEICRQQFTSVR